MATIDASIAMSGRLPKIDSPLEAQAKAMQFREMQQRNKLAEMMFADKERESGERNALSGIMSDQSNYDAAGNLRRQALPKIGATAPGQYGAFQKQIGEQEKAQREVEKEKIARAKSEMELVGQVAGAARDQASYTRGLQMLQQAGIDVSQIPPQFDPAYVQQAQAQAMSATQQLEQMWKQKGYDLDASKFGYQQQNDAANRGVTIRGQNMTDSRGREANDINRQLVGEKKQLEVDALKDKKRERDMMKQSSVAKAQGSLDLIDKALNHPGLSTATGIQGAIDPRNYTPGTDATNFQVILDQLGGQAFLQAFESLKGGGQITEVEGKKATDAMARLNRKQSTAEFKKSLNDLREVVSAGLARAGGGEPAGAATSGAPKAGAVMDGFRFKGGDPGNKANWEKV